MKIKIEFDFPDKSFVNLAKQVDMKSEGGATIEDLFIDSINKAIISILDSSIETSNWRFSSEKELPS